MSHKKGKNTTVMGILFWPLDRSGKPRPGGGELDQWLRPKYGGGDVEM